MQQVIGKTADYSLHYAVIVQSERVRKIVEEYMDDGVKHGWKMKEFNVFVVVMRSAEIQNEPERLVSLLGSSKPVCT